MKILFAIKGLNEAVGGAERVLCLLAGEMARRGHAVSVMTYDQPGGRPFFGLSPDVRTLALGIGCTDGPASRWETLRRMVALRRTARAERPEIVVAFMPSMFVPLSFALAGTGLPVIASERNAASSYRGHPARWALLHSVPFLACRITTLSDRLTEGFPPLLRRSMIAIPNPVELRCSRADTNHRGRQTLLAVGSLLPKKDHSTLIDAFAALAGEFANWDLRIVGEGPLRPTLEQRVEQLGLGRRVSLPGSTAEIEAEYVGAQLYVVPSIHEGFPCATAEALAHGLPAVGFAQCPGTNELIRDGTNGMLVAGEDRVNALASGLRALMCDAEVRARLGAAAPATLAAFEPARIYDRWERLLEDHARRPSPIIPS